MVVGEVMMVMGILLVVMGEVLMVMGILLVVMEEVLIVVGGVVGGCSVLMSSGFPSNFFSKAS